MDTNPDPNLLNTGSVEFTASLNYTTTGNDRHLAVLYKKVEELTTKVHDLETKKILVETHIPSEVLKETGLLPEYPVRWKSGRGFRPPLLSEIQEAKKHSSTAAGQARWLGLSITTYKKYAVPMGVYEPKPNIKGQYNPRDAEAGKYPLSKILKGEFNGHPLMTDWIVKKKLFAAKTFPEECAICKYKGRHIVTNRPFLLIDHMDGDRRNYKLENIRFLCTNCTIECGRGYFRRGIHSFDPDWHR